MSSKLPKLHIIVNCVSRKHFEPKLFLRDFSDSSIDSQAETWWKQLNKSSEIDNSQKLLPASSLYAGNFWQLIIKLKKLSVSIGYDTNLWIISAGYGLLNESDQIKSYSATFAEYNPDSILNCKLQNTTNRLSLQKWWKLINKNSLPNSKHPRSFVDLFKGHSDDLFLIIASENYLTAVEADIKNGIRHLSKIDNLLIISSKSVIEQSSLKKFIIPTDARLQCNRECSASCSQHLLPAGIKAIIGAQIALSIINFAKKNGFIASHIKEWIIKKIKNSPPIYKYRRHRLSDEELLNFIALEKKSKSNASYTYLLKKLRGKELACSQKRLKEFYNSSVE